MKSSKLKNAMKVINRRNVFFFIALLFSGCMYLMNSCEINKDWDDYYKSPSVTVEDNVLKILKEEGNFNRFYEAILETGYDSLLIKNQYFTIFAPTDEAFEGLPEYTDAEWKDIIGFHICYFNLFSRAFSDINLQTIIGKYLNIRSAGDGNYTIFEANINNLNVDLECQNGVIHEIDKLLIPKKNLYEYIMSLDETYSLMKQYLNSMDVEYIDLEKSTRIGVDDNGNTIYDTVWAKDNYFLDNVAMLNQETESYTVFIPTDEDVYSAFTNAEEYFGDVNDMDEDAFFQLLSITFSANFHDGIYNSGEFPDTMTAVTGKNIATGDLDFSSNVDLEMSNGVVHFLDAVNIPKEFFLNIIIVECDDKKGRRVSNTVYPLEIRSDSRATRGTYLYYESQFVGDYVEFTVNMVLATKYWFVWTGPALGGSYYQLSVDGVRIGDSVECYYKGNFKPVVAGNYTFEHFGTKTVRMTMVNEKTLPGYNALYLDYIKLIPDELYKK